MLRKHIYQHLQDILGDVAIYPSEAPEDATLPAVAYSIISNIPGRKLSGASGEATARVQIDVESTDHAEIDTLAHTLTTSLHGYRGEIGDDLWGVVWQDNEIEKPKPYVDGSGRTGYMTSRDFMIHYCSKSA